MNTLAPLHARVLIAELVVPEDQAPHWSKTLDIVMLCLFGGRQRTQDEHRIQLESSGFTFVHTVPAGNGLTLIEAEAMHRSGRGSTVV